ncbi:Ion channel [Luteipulveratus halotolerans]|uniref:Ion channel n=1 Tax=Luteipulveratus halotolerans TaxID=1631356 RepID=A0A0L6CN62_9MICO|nr:Ion channel [Luteipulveratus halotolerans]
MRTLPCAALLIVQLLGIVVYPFTESDIGRAAFSLFQLLVLVIAVAAVRMTPALSRVLVTLGVPAAVLTIAEAFAPDHDVVQLLSGITHAAFYLYLAYGLIRYMFSDEHVTTDEMFATGACFTVVAWAFAYLYGVVQVVWGADQFATAEHHGDLSWMELLFLSFTTMTNTGLSDISPVGTHARSVVMLEQLSGLYYIALVVARLLGMMLAKFSRTPG